MKFEWLPVWFIRRVNTHVSIFFTANGAACEDAWVEKRKAFDLVRHDFFEKIFERLAVEIFSYPLGDCDVSETDVFVSIRVVVVKIVFEVAQPNLE